MPPLVGIGPQVFQHLPERTELRQTRAPNTPQGGERGEGSHEPREDRTVGQAVWSQPVSDPHTHTYPGDRNLLFGARVMIGTIGAPAAPHPRGCGGVSGAPEAAVKGKEGRRSGADAHRVGLSQTRGPAASGPWRGDDAAMDWAGGVWTWAGQSPRWVRSPPSLSLQAAR